MVIEEEDYVSVADGFLFGLGLGMSFIVLIFISALLGALFQYLEKLNGKSKVL